MRKKIKIKRFNSVKSTNDEAIKMIRKKISRPTIIIALSQTKGRGTMGKKWISMEGNIFVSIFFRFNPKKIKFNQFAVINPFLIKNAIQKYSKHKIKIKWPNDLLIKGKKFCGILQEVIEYNKKKYLITGVGINSLFKPNNKKFKSISLNDCSDKIIENKKILDDIKVSYEKFLIDMEKYNFNSLKRKVINNR